MYGRGAASIFVEIRWACTVVEYASMLGVGTANRATQAKKKR